MENQPHNEIEIKPLGSYFETDEEGYIVNPTSLENIQEEWKPAVDDVAEAYKKNYGEALRAVYLRGSVAKGQAIEGISDVDTFAYVDLPKEEINGGWQAEAKKELKERYPFIEDVELNTRPLSVASANGILLNQSVCIYGEAVEVPKMKPGKEMMMHIPHLVERVGRLEGMLEKDGDDEGEVKATCTWFMKDMLRTASELVMEESQKYTRDLYLCYKSFSEYYPEKEPEMREVLTLALNPVSDKEKIRQVRDVFASWLIEESQKYR